MSNKSAVYTERNLERPYGRPTQLKQLPRQQQQQQQEEEEEEEPVWANSPCRKQIWLPGSLSVSLFHRGNTLTWDNRQNVMLQYVAHVRNITHHWQAIGTQFTTVCISFSLCHAIRTRGFNIHVRCLCEVTTQDFQLHVCLHYLLRHTGTHLTSFPGLRTHLHSLILIQFRTTSIYCLTEVQSLQHFRGGLVCAYAAGSSPILFRIHGKHPVTSQISRCVT